jgi:uncharacterized membrane protein
MNDEIKRYLEPGKKNLILIYISYLCGIILPILPIIGVVFAFANMNHNDARWRSHYIFAFRTFAFGLLGIFVSMITTLIFIGPIVYMVVFVWFVVRSIVGLQFAFEGIGHPNPLTFWIK